MPRKEQRKSHPEFTGEQLCDLRKRLKLTQAQLAEQIGYRFEDTTKGKHSATVMISRLEKGDRPISGIVRDFLEKQTKNVS